MKGAFSLNTLLVGAVWPPDLFGNKMMGGRSSTVLCSENGHCRLIWPTFSQRSARFSQLLSRKCLWGQSNEGQQDRESPREESYPENYAGSRLLQGHLQKTFSTPLKLAKKVAFRENPEMGLKWVTSGLRPTFDPFFHPKTHFWTHFSPFTKPILNPL